MKLTIKWSQNFEWSSIVPVRFSKESKAQANTLFPFRNDGSQVSCGKKYYVLMSPDSPVFCTVEPVKLSFSSKASKSPAYIVKCLCQNEEHSNSSLLQFFYTEKYVKSCFSIKNWFRPANGVPSTRLLVKIHNTIQWVMKNVVSVDHRLSTLSTLSTSIFTAVFITPHYFRVWPSFVFLISSQ